MVLRGRFALLGAVTFVLLAGACSLLNRDGPDVTCADLQNGAANACADGIIATCTGESVSYKVCDEKSACTAPWQTSGRYRCSDTEPLPASDGGTSSGSNGPPPVAVCGTCPGGYQMVANACNQECGDCGCFQRLCVSDEQYAVGVAIGQNGCKSGERSILSVPDCLEPAQCGKCGTRDLCIPAGDVGGGTKDGTVPGSGADASTLPDSGVATDANSRACTAPADEACGGDGRRYCTDGHTWTECLFANSNCIESKSGGWSSFANTAGGACSSKSTGAVVACTACAGSVICGETWNCAAPAGANLYACGKPGTVVKEPNTASGETYCLSTGNFMNRGAASGTELGPEVSLCDPPYKPGDDVEACAGGPGSAEVCYPSCAIGYVRVCRTTGKWSACHRGSL